MAPRHPWTPVATETIGGTGTSADRTSRGPAGPYTGKMLEKSKPVPYSAVVPVDIPPMIASSTSGPKYQASEIASSPPT